DDQCIGCQYCVMKCPYDVPKYSERLGIVRKCDLCHQRLAEGEAPACVQACPNGAIKITVVNRDDIARKYRQPETTEARGFAEPDFGELAASLSEPGCTNRFLPGSPEPAYTLPTTRFKSRNPQVAALHAANEAVLKPEHAHWPLVFLLVLSQLSVGLLLAGGLLTIGTGQTDAAAPPPAAGHPVLVFGAAMAMALALGLATLHLGRPLKAWRAFLGWRRSWFSREAIAFGGYMGALALTALAAGFPPMMQLAADSPANGFAVTALAWSLPLALALGAVSIFCSFMLYVDTRREFWAAYPTGVRFFGSTLLFAAGGWLLVDPSPNGWLTLIAVALTKLLLESTVLRHHNAPDWTPLKRTARLILGPLRPIAGFRVTALLFAGVAFPLLGLLGMVPPDSGLAALVLSGLVAGELAERHLFFTAVSPTQMPKGISA
ncbi:MAG TPA: hypothetical protein DCY13_12805, partial [Verrucomicrobiales bacterium]|nr:hypothetical protein [Verrucomicrobiales bacterium]